ncbi:hypothetical protein [Scytonema sp. NUACC26]|uniref:hypothetical protein n=1 Tax=Scytonema sp. NUACC26 TaxID=3140176 RepID=UPI0034DC8AF4
MPHRYYEATHHELDPTRGEYTRLDWTPELPSVGEIVRFGSARPWKIVAVDEYKLAEQTQPEFEADSSIFLNHCALQQEALSDRSAWTRVEMFQENPLTILQIFVSSERNLIQSSIHFYGKRARVGSHLKQYDYQRREFVKLPWRVSRMDTYLPNPEQNPLYCYAAIHIAHCVSVPLIEDIPPSKTLVHLKFMLFSIFFYISNLKTL